MYTSLCCFYCTHMIHLCLHYVPQCTCGAQRISVRSASSPTMWAPGITESPGLEADAVSQWAVLPAPFLILLCECFLTLNCGRGFHCTGLGWKDLSWFFVAHTWSPFLSLPTTVQMSLFCCVLGWSNRKLLLMCLQITSNSVQEQNKNKGMKIRDLACWKEH